MRFIRVLGIIAALCAVIVLSALAGEKHVGARVFLRNASQCDVVLMEEHAGATIHPGERVLAKSGFIERSPSMLLVAKHQIWSGLRFSEVLVDLRSNDGVRTEVAIPAQWWVPSLLGKELTFEIESSGVLVLGMSDAGSRPSSQPAGFPLAGRTGSGIPMQNELLCH